MVHRGMSAPDLSFGTLMLTLRQRPVQPERQ
ncbi:hypothetical protein RSAG8_11071, partial [Rhizoctonia solani AG-8 WAC10335]